MPDRITTQTELYEMWRTLMGPLGFGGRSLWLVFIARDGVPIRKITKVEDLTEIPDPELALRLMSVCADVAGDSGERLAVLHSRPGHGPLSEHDRAWARVLLDAANAADVSLLPLHRANDENLVVVAPDDLARSG